MSFNGVDITQMVGVVCGSAWIVFYIALIWFVWTRKPKTLIGRRWKAAWLIGGLPVLGMPFALPIILPLIVSSQVVFQGDFAGLKVSAILQSIFDLVILNLGMIACIAPFAIFASLGSAYGVYHNFRVRLDHGLDKIIPPSKDEKPRVWDES